MDTQVADGMSLVEPLSATESTNVGAGEQRPSDAPKQLHDSEQSALSCSLEGSNPVRSNPDQTPFFSKMVCLCIRILQAS